MAALLVHDPTPSAPLQLDDTASRHERADECLSLAATSCDPLVGTRLRQEAVLLTLDLPDRVARRYGGRGVDREDLVQVGRMALVKAAGSYRVGLGHGFAAYALPTVLGEVKRHFRDAAWAVRPPRRLQELRSEVVATEDLLAQQLRRRPTVQEVAEVLGVGTEDVRSARQSGGAYAASSLDVSMDQGGEGEVVARESSDIDRLLRSVVVGQGMSRLTDRERLIVQLRFVDERTQSEIGAVLGVSQMQVSRLLSGIVTRLRRDLLEVAAA